MTIFRALGAVVGLLLLGACTTHYIDDQLGPVESNPGEGSAFAKGLHKDYSALARDLQHAGFLSDALYWNEKSARAAAGQEVSPENPDVQGMHPADLAEANKAEVRLKIQLAGDARVRDPDDLALAQVSFDCMVKHWERDVYKSILDNCKNRFEQAMQRLEAKPMEKAAMVPSAPAPTDFWVYFDFDKFNIRADAARVLDQVIASIRKLGSPHVTLTGHADTVGTVQYNLKLSRERAASAKTYLTQQGVAAGTITTVGKGKTDLKVPTPDQVREQENRNVHIELQ
jgi:OmpA-OmpF porin, OOP family